jgi:glycosidase
MWTWNEERQQFYLHQFGVKQPDLDFRNPAVRQEMKVRQLAAEAYVYRFNVVFDFKSNQRGH